MKRRVTLGFALAVAATAQAAYLEDWDLSALSNHNWSSWTAGVGWTGSVPMVYHPFGGVGNLNYVRTWPLEELALWLNAYWPAYTESYPTNRLREPSQDLRLDRDTIIRVYCRTLSPSDTLYDASVYFFVGEWQTNGNIAFYYHSTPVTVNTNNWTARSTIDLSKGNWITITNINGRPVDQLYTNPQQWGFVIVGATSRPAGQLGFDQFSSLAADLTLTNLVATNETLHAATNSITATNRVVIEASGKADFIAGSKTRLDPGFHAKTGSVFRARLEPGL